MKKASRRVSEPRRTRKRAAPARPASRKSRAAPAELVPDEEQYSEAAGLQQTTAESIACLNPVLIEEGIRRLREVDPILRGVIDQVGPFRLKKTSNHFHSLARAIVSQQISTTAARSIWDRLLKLDSARPFSPELTQSFTDDQLRGAGLSPQKVRYLRDLSARIADGRLKLPRLSRQPDDVVVESLVEVKGIGEWTAQMFLMFSLGRADVFAPDDLGLRTAIKQHYELETLPNQALSLQIAEPWKPYRSLASWYLWRSLELSRAAQLNAPTKPERPRKQG